MVMRCGDVGGASRVDEETEKKLRGCCSSCIITEVLDSVLGFRCQELLQRVLSLTRSFFLFLVGSDLCGHLWVVVLGCTGGGAIVKQPPLI